MGHAADYPGGWPLDPRFMGGVVLMLAGAALKTSTVRTKRVGRSHASRVHNPVRVLYVSAADFTALFLEIDADSAACDCG